MKGVVGKLYNSVSMDEIGMEVGFSGPYAIAIGGDGNLFVVEIINSTIRKMNS